MIDYYGYIEGNIIGCYYTIGWCYIIVGWCYMTGCDYIIGCDYIMGCYYIIGYYYIIEDGGCWATCCTGSTHGSGWVVELTTRIGVIIFILSS